MRCQKHYSKNFKKGENGNFIFFLKITKMEVDNCMIIYIFTKIEKKKIDMIFLFSVKVFFILVGKLMNILFCIKILF